MCSFVGPSNQTSPPSWHLIWSHPSLSGGHPKLLKEKKDNIWEEVSYNLHCELFILSFKAVKSLLLLIQLSAQIIVQSVRGFQCLCVRVRACV